MKDKIVINHLEESVEEVSNLVWGDDEKTHVLCVLKLSSGLEFPFSAHPNDSEEHGALLYEHILAGKFGKIAKFKAPKEAEPIDALTKLKTFLKANPDVAELLK